MIIERIEKFDGTFLRKRFAYDFFKDKTQSIGNIIAFRAPISVDVKNLVDKENIIREEGLYADDAVNFCIEIPNISLFAGVCFQRLFNTCIGNMLASEFLKCDVEIDDAAIIIHKEIEENGIIKTRGKASVSDVTLVDGAVLIYTGINIKAGNKAPAIAYSTNLTDDQPIILMRKGIEYFYSVIHDIFIETTKKVVSTTQ